MVDQELVRRKLSRLNMYLDKLEPIIKRSLNEYLSDFYLKSSAERMIQLIVECASDINSHVVVESGNRPPEDYTSSFIRASEVGLIKRDLADRIKGSGGMRNILVHEYMDIDDEKVYKTLPIVLSDYKEYISQVDDYLDNLK
ncbi:DUF86 domain-containing protein [Candidatus Saganbacteria bacterium]|nr:DUF86 domain-containing protein [Candidatus Saganbacteria bacterium]